MQNDATKKTKSARRFILAVVMLLLAVAAIGYLIYWSQGGYDQLGILRRDGQTRKLEIAATPDRQAIGLSGRDSLGEDAGMIFAYDRPSLNRCFWMPDMRFSIDIIWLDGAMRVVTVRENIAPETYPERFCPDKPAQYVVELRAGDTAALGIKNSDILDIDLAE